MAINHFTNNIGPLKRLQIFKRFVLQNWLVICNSGSVWIDPTFKFFFYFLSCLFNCHHFRRNVVGITMCNCLWKSCSVLNANALVCLLYGICWTPIKVSNSHIIFFKMYFHPPSLIIGWSNNKFHQSEAYVLISMIICVIIWYKCIMICIGTYNRKSDIELHTSRLELQVL